MKTIYLNNAATSWPKPDTVGQALLDTVRALPAHAHRAAMLGMETGKGVDCRALLAGQMKLADPNRLVYAQNATQALNIALLGFPYPENARVVTTAAEHNSVLRPLYALQKRGGVRLTVLPVDGVGRADPELWRRTLRQLRPSLCVFSHASNVTGAVNPARELARAAREAGAATVLDASQTMGLLPVLPEEWGVDMVAFTGHKYLLGPQGTGGLYVGPGVELEPVYAGGTGIRSAERDMPQELPARLEAGTGNDPGFAALGAALLWTRENPLALSSILARTDRMAQALEELGCRVIRPDGYCPDGSRPEGRTPVLSFTHPSLSPEEIGDMLSGGFSILTRTGLHCAPLLPPYIGTAPAGTVRASLSRFTTDEETEAFIQAMKEILYD